MADDDYQELLAAMVDREMYQSEAMYRAQVSTFRRWLTMTEAAMADEGIDAETRRKVLHRMIYGAPEASDAYLRLDRMRQTVAAAEVGTPFRSWWVSRG